MISTWFLEFWRAKRILSRIEHGRTVVPTYDHVKKLDRINKLFKKKKYDLTKMCELAMKLFQLSNPAITLETLDNFTVGIHGECLSELRVTAVSPCNEHGCNIAVGLATTQASTLIVLFPDKKLHVGSNWSDLDQLRKKLHDGVDIDSYIPNTTLTYAFLLDLLPIMLAETRFLKIELLKQIDAMEA